MLREWVARSTAGQEDLYLVLIEDLSPPADSDERAACQLMINRHHLSRDREQIASMDFTDLAHAQDYCFKEYGVAPGDWMHEIRLPCAFRFNYTVSNSGVPQPYPVASPNAKILFRFTPAEDEDGRSRRVLNICGTREGMERLAAMLVLCADSEKYDPEFHIHLEDQHWVETDIDVTIRAPVYLDVLRSAEFSEFKGTKLPLPPDDAAEDPSPNTE
jgi:hypothetical protein